MARCEDCLHYKLCVDTETRHLKIILAGDKAERCKQFMPTADVVPKSEADEWYHEYHAIKEALKQEKMYHRATEKLADRYCAEFQTAKKEVASKIIDDILSKIRTMIKEIEKVDRCVDSYSEFNGGSKTALEIVFKDISELKKKYTEIDNDGTTGD